MHQKGKTVVIQEGFKERVHKGREEVKKRVQRSNLRILWATTAHPTVN